MNKILVTGGLGFIGSNFIRYWLKKYPKDKVTNLDKITYAGHISSTKDFSKNKNYNLVKGDICDPKVVDRVMKDIDVVVHFAAESHVDRSILDPQAFIKTNVIGTQTELPIPGGSSNALWGLTSFVLSKIKVSTFPKVSLSGLTSAMATKSFPVTGYTILFQPSECIARITLYFDIEWLT